MENEHPEFDHWCFTARSEVMMDGKPLPLLTLFLHRVCDNDEKKFDEGVAILREAFQAGRDSASR